LKEDGTYVNIADILGEADTGEKRDISKYSPMSGRMIKEDGTVVNIAENIGGGVSGRTTNYNNLTIKPAINGVTLEGNNTGEEIGLINENQGVENAGKVLGIGSDGNVTPVSSPLDEQALLEKSIENYYAMRRTGKVYQTKL